MLGIPGRARDAFDAMSSRRSDPTASRTQLREPAPRSIARSCAICLAQQVQKARALQVGSTDHA